MVAVIDKCRLQRGFNAGNFGEVDITLYLLLSGSFEIELFESIAVEHHHPGLFRVGGIDEHTSCHSGITPGRAAAAARKSAGGALLSARKPQAPEAIPLSDEKKSAMVLSGEPFSGFGFLRSVSPGAASWRGG